MAGCTRRAVLAGATAAMAAFIARAQTLAAAGRHEFIEAAFAMREQALRAGDQPYGAVLVRDGRIVGFGPSRVIVNRDWTAHAEREAIRDAQARLGVIDLSGCELYSTSRPCAICERAAGDANVARMYYGPEAIDAGVPAGRSFGPIR
jgi:tRNA(Arg) A34 adenosine deaminase TadA